MFHPNLPISSLIFFLEHSVQLIISSSELVFVEELRLLSCEWGVIGLGEHGGPSPSVKVPTPSNGLLVCVAISDVSCCVGLDSWQGLVRFWGMTGWESFVWFGKRLGPSLGPPDSNLNLPRSTLWTRDSIKESGDSRMQPFLHGPFCATSGRSSFKLSRLNIMVVASLPVSESSK